VRIRSLDHLVLTVADVGRTVDFYERLGMEARTFEDGRVALHFGDQKINLHLRGAEIEPHAATPLAGSADLCFLVDELPAESGLPVELGPVERTGAHGPLRSVYLRDPDGNLIELSVPLD
jgi:catechol 2,3-dioxygenase-like lactoylglutathione lyase family enzyme